MALSKELQLGKAAEHFVCYDLISKGYNAFLSDQGLPYDAVIDHNSKLYKIQIKSTLKKVSYGNRKNIYSFGLINGKHRIKSMRSYNVDYVAFFVFNLKLVAYLSVDKLINIDNKILTGIQFRDRNDIYDNQIIKKATRYFQDYLELNI